MPRPLFERFKIALAVAALSTGVAAASSSFFAPAQGSPSLGYFLLAVIFSAWYGGWLGALLSIALTGLGGVLWLLPMDAPAAHLQATRRILNFDLLALLISGIVVAVREKKIARKLLKRTEERYELLFKQSPLPMWVFSQQTLKFLDVNEAAKTHYGYSQSDFLQMTIKDIRPPTEVPLVAEGIPQRKLGVENAGTWRHIKKDGTVMEVETTSSPIEWQDEPAVMVIVRDITEKRRLEEHLRQAQKMDAIGQLAGGIAHDFNNLLGVVIGYSELLLEQTGADDPKREKIDQIKKAGDHGASLTRQLLAFSRKQVLEPKVLDLNAVVSDLSKMLQRLIRESIKLVIVSGEALGRVKVDPGQLEQVIINLALNARDAMPNGGRLAIETANLELDEAYSRTHAEVAPGHYVMLAVSDNGIGMDAATKARVFEPFFTTKEKGTGLGLATAYGIVKQSGGHIWVYSEQGKGTTFKVYFPRVQELESVHYAAPTLPPSGSETILLVEDAAGLRGFTKESLQSRGYRVLEAENGKQAIEVASAYAGPIHLLLTDVVLPEMGGREVAKRLIELQPKAKVLFMSGYTDDAIIQQGVLENGVHFMQKPFTTYTLASKVREALGCDH